MRNRGWIGLALVAVGLAVVPLLVEVLDLSTFYLVFLSGILFWTAQSTSWNILSGYSGYFSFGQGAFYGVGVYSMAVLFGRHGLDWLVALAIGGLLAMLLGLGIGFVAFRLRSLRGEIFALLTLAVPFILAALVRLSDTIDGGQGIVVPVPEFPEALGSFQSFFYVCSAVVGVFALTVAFVMERTRYGWALFAVRDDEAVAEGLGVPTFRHKMIAIAANGLIGGVSGAVFGLNLGFISVEGTFNLTVPLFVIVMSVLGGRNHWAGPMLGAVYIHTLQNRLADSGFEGWSLIVLGGILILLVVLAPEGLMARMRRRPWLVSGALVATLLGLGLWGGWGQPVDWLAVGLAAAVVVAFLPSKRRSGVTARARPSAAERLYEDETPGERGRPLVVAEGVTKDFGGVHALRGVSLTVSEGELIGLVGPNGSGKTTLVNLIAGASRLTAGTIAVDGTNLAGIPQHRVAHLGIARTYQIPRPFSTMTLRDNVAVAIMFGRDPHGLSEARAAAEEFLSLVGLDHLAAEYPGKVNLHERQLLEMARAMATRPSVLLLDEALAGLNPVEVDNAVRVVRRIHDSGVAIVFVEHVLRVVNQLATRIVVLDHGVLLAEGDPAAVMSDPAVVSAYLGKEGHARSH
ncbi:MAG TPA: branched-chain amino acid ABC transporter ATP-binding protein/permease [Acidimicrobiia bacterium]|jgi:branched-chain amino acid transport system permease protein|nr:branched-chain amino acid ABC transporter ATP-binding protein/permease [Acidimicrobiia bacterium]